MKKGVSKDEANIFINKNENMKDFMSRCNDNQRIVEDL